MNSSDHWDEDRALLIARRKIRLRRVLRCWERQRQLYHGFAALQARGYATHVRPQVFAAKFRRVRLCRIPRLLLSGE